MTSCIRALNCFTYLGGNGGLRGQGDKGATSMAGQT